MRNEKICVAIIAAIAFVGCSEESVKPAQTENKRNSVSIESPVVNPNKEVVKNKPATPPIVIFNAAGNPSKLKPNEGLSLALDSDYVSISGTAVGNSANGPTSGAFIHLNRKLEERLSGQSVTVKFTASSPDNASVKTAYSTAQVGNSGWKTFELTPEFKSFEFKYQVPEMKDPHGDYLGFAPVGGTVRLKSVHIKVH